MLLVYLPPNLLAVQRIAFFGENVYILYMVEMVMDCTMLLFYTFERPKNLRLPDVYCNES